MIYKIFPTKTSTIYSFFPDLNTGNDEIMEISTFLSINQTNEISRGLIQFSSDDISTVMSLVGTASFDNYLKLYLANTTSIPLEYSLYCHQLAQQWNEGTGRLSNLPQTTDGVSWTYRDQYSGSGWFPTTSSFDPYTTGSYSGSFGGGEWYTASFATQSFGKLDTKDIEFKVTNIVTSWLSGSDNNGFLIKNSHSLEFTSQSKFELKYFTENTHTIYPPCLEFRWDDSQYITGSPIVLSDQTILTLGNNYGSYQQDSVKKFVINARDRYPARVFQTSSLYLDNKILPSSSYWSIKDYDTEEIVIDYDTNYTKISSDGSNSYFTIYMNGLQPNRYFKLLLKVILPSGEIIIYDDDYIFKVIR